MSITTEQWSGFLSMLQNTFAETNNKISELASSIGKIEEKVGKIDSVEKAQSKNKKIKIFLFYKK